MASDLSKKSPDQVLLEMKASDLKVQIGSLKIGNVIRARKEAGLKQVESELAAIEIK